MHEMCNFILCIALQRHYFPIASCIARIQYFGPNKIFFIIWQRIITETINHLALRHFFIRRIGHLELILSRLLTTVCIQVEERSIRTIAISHRLLNPIQKLILTLLPETLHHLIMHHQVMTAVASSLS